jgi:TorA maturation chaperone TorD
MVGVDAGGDREVTTSTDDRVATTLGRAGVYRLIGGAFAYPTKERLAELARAAATIAATTPAGPVRDAVATFAAAAFEADADAVGTEYVFLFDRQLRCAPYEGAWGDAPQMAGKSAALADVAGFYRAFGLEPSGAQADTEDHLVPELEFMSAVALKEAWAVSEGALERAEITHGAQRAFVTDHLGRWAPAFAEELAGATPLAYYRAAATLLAEWMRADMTTLDVTPDAQHARRAADTMQSEAFSCPMAPDEGAPDDLPRTE